MIMKYHHYLYKFDENFAKIRGRCFIKNVLKQKLKIAKIARASNSLLTGGSTMSSRALVPVEET